MYIHFVLRKMFVLQLVNDAERSLIDDLIDFGSQTAGKVDYISTHSLYKYVHPKFYFSF